MQCNCRKPAREATSQSQANPNRKFATCGQRTYSRASKRFGGGCDFFKWLPDEYEADFIDDDEDEYEAGPPTAPPAKRTKIEFLPTHIVNELAAASAQAKQVHNCTVCLEDIKTAEMAITTCGHRFCKTCIKTVSARGMACPCCRA